MSEISFHSGQLGGQIVIFLNGSSQHIEFDSFLECIGDGISIQDKNFKIIYQNDAHKEIVGDHVGEFCYRAYSFQEQICEECPVTLAFRDGRKHTKERTTYPPGGGGVRHVEITASPLKTSAGEIIAAIEVVRDIGVRKRMEEELKESEKWFREIFARAPVGMVIADQHGHYLDANHSFCRLLGYEKQELLGLDIKGVTHPEDVDSNLRLFNSLLRGDIPAYFFEKRYRRKDGSTVWVRISATTLRHNGDSPQLIALAENITDRKRAEEELRESRERFRDLIETTSDWVWEVDEQGVYTYASPQVKKILGYEPEEVLGKTPFDLMPPEEAERVAGLFKEIAGAQKTFSCLENSNLHKSGARVVLESSGIPFFDSPGSFRGYRGIDRDITERKRVEEELQKTQHLESIGLLAGGIAHDFNNILAAILGNIELARMYLPPAEKAAQRLSIAEQAAVRARGLTQQLLTFSKGGEPIKKVSSVPHFLQESVDFALQGSKVKSEFSFPEDLRLIEFDENQMRQVINNLVINACEAMQDGGLLTIRARNEIVPANNPWDLNKGNYVRIDVTDRGAGIPKKHLDKIFDPYFTTKETGSGLGLSISYSIIKKHGGTITVDSVPGKGSTFTIFLPATEKAATVTPAMVEKDKESGAGRRVLLMDDEEEVRAVAADMLEFLGYRVETVRDGTEAVVAYRDALAAGKPYDAVITDLTVPAGMGGKETVRRLLEIDSQANVMVSSGYANDPIMSGYADYGFKGVIPKPYRLDELGETLQEVIGNRHE